MVKKNLISTGSMVLKACAGLGLVSALTACSAMNGRWSDYNYGYNDVRLTSGGTNLSAMMAGGTSPSEPQSANMSETSMSSDLMSLMPYYNPAGVASTPTIVGTTKAEVGGVPVPLSSMMTGQSGDKPALVNLKTDTAPETTVPAPLK